MPPAWTHTVTGGPWWDRVGHRCRIVTPADTPESPDGTYPWDGKDQTYRDKHSLVVVVIEDDPLDGRPFDDPERGPWEASPSAVTGWSCSIDRADITPI